MNSIAECILAFLATAGLAALLWLLFGRLLTPCPDGQPSFAVLPVCGDAELLEQTVSHLLWLNGGKLLTLPIILVDTGLSAAGQARVAALLSKEPLLSLTTPEALLTLLQKDG